MNASHHGNRSHSNSVKTSSSLLFVLTWVNYFITEVQSPGPEFNIKHCCSDHLPLSHQNNQTVPYIATPPIRLEFPTPAHVISGFSTTASARVSQISLTRPRSSHLAANFWQRGPWKVFMAFPFKGLATDVFIRKEWERGSSPWHTEELRCDKYAKWRLCKQDFLTGISLLKAATRFAPGFQSERRTVLGGSKSICMWEPWIGCYRRHKMQSAGKLMSLTLLILMGSELTEVGL